MNILLLTVVILGVAIENISKKAYNERIGGGGAYFFSAICSLVAMLFFLITSRKFTFDIRILPYSIGFGIALSVSSIFSVLAIEHGSLSLSALFISYSLLLPTLYGLIVLKDPISKGLFPGILLLLISLYLTNKKSDTVPITIKWIVYIFFTFMGGGLCSIIQNIQQLKFNHNYKSEFMFTALLFSTICVSIISFLKERKKIKIYLKKGWIFGSICGLLVGLVNLFVMLLLEVMPASLIFPLITAGGIIITYFISKLYYKEALSKRQLVGFLLGTLSVICLSI